jgi:hypothetical protein
MAARVAASVPRPPALAPVLWVALGTGLVVVLDHALKHTEADRQCRRGGQWRDRSGGPVCQRMSGDVADVAGDRDSQTGECDQPGSSTGAWGPPVGQGDEQGQLADPAMKTSTCKGQMTAHDPDSPCSWLQSYNPR